MGHNLVLYHKDSADPESEETMEEKTPLFVGYGTFEEWMQALLPDRPVLAMPLVEQGPEQSGMRTDTLVVTCQQIDPDGHVHYCRLRAASLTRCYGEPFSADWREREAAWRSLWDAVQEILRERSLTYRGATVAHPQHLRFLEARADGIAFDPDLKRFMRPSAQALKLQYLEGDVKR
ncbi:MAG: hypothetical protein JWN14_4391 [Chthonomonadales bacterium]|nr:hypothetical protein [Chthonomonadales bacterium]